MTRSRWFRNCIQGSLIALLATALAIPAHAATFRDVATEDPYAGYIHVLASEGIASGTGDGKFGPELTLTRAEFAAFLAKAFALPAAKSPAPFRDIEKHWAANSIQAAYAAGLVNGVSATVFAPSQPVKRQEAAAVTWRYLKSQGIEVREQYQVLHPDDMPDQWAIEAVKNMTAYELHGPGGEVKYYPEGAKYRPKEDMLRKEMAALLVTAMTELKIKQEQTAANGTTVVKDYWGTHTQPKLPQRGVVIERYAGNAKPIMTIRITDVLQPEPEGFLTKRDDGVYKLANIPLLHMKSNSLDEEQMEEMTRSSNDAAYLMAKLEFIAQPENKRYTVKLPESDGFVWKRYDPNTGTIGIVIGETSIDQGTELYIDTGTSPSSVNRLVMQAIFQGEREDGMPNVQRIQAYAVN